MSTKFEQLLDYLVNEEMDKANELFHDIVVDKSREIYETLIAEEEDESEMDEAYEEEEEESVEENLEDSYSMEADDEIGGDATDEFGQEIAPAGNDEFDSEDGEEEDESAEDTAIYDIKNAIAELEAAFAELEAAQSDEAEHHDMGDMDSEEGSDEFDDEDEEEESMGYPMEARRMTREYVEKVPAAKGPYAGSGSGDTVSAPVEGHSPVSSGKGKPTTGAGPIKATGTTSDEDGTTPRGKVGGLVKKGSDLIGKVQNTAGGNAGVKSLSKVSQNSKTPAPVGSGTGELAGQTSVAPIKPFLKHL